MCPIPSFCLPGSSLKYIIKPKERDEPKGDSRKGWSKELINARHLFFSFTIYSWSNGPRVRNSFNNYINKEPRTIGTRRRNSKGEEVERLIICCRSRSTCLRNKLSYNFPLGRILHNPQDYVIILLIIKGFWFLPAISLIKD